MKLYQQTGRRAVRRKKTADKRDFIREYNSGAYPQLFGLLGKKSWQTLERWAKKLLETGDPFELAPRWGKHLRGKTAVTEDQARCLAKVAPHYPHRAEAVRAAREMMAAQGVKDTCCERTYVNFLKKHFATERKWWAVPTLHFFEGIKALVAPASCRCKHRLEACATNKQSM